MSGPIHPFLTESDNIVLKNLFGDLKGSCSSGVNDQLFGDKKHVHVSEKELSDSDSESDASSNDDQAAIDHLIALNDGNNPAFTPTVFTSLDEKDIPAVINTYIVKPYIKIAKNIVRHPTDVVFLTHILLYFATSVPSAIYLFNHFNWIHGILHAVWSLYCCGPFTLMLHNHIHNNGVLNKKLKWVDRTFPYVLEPLYGHTWDSYYYHHVKHHHVEGNGPDDLSSTVRYQRDSVRDFACYVGRFFFFCWIELPIYFLRKNKPGLALKAGGSELANYAFFYIASSYHWRAALCTLLIPFIQMRIGLMVGNWGQHALVDEIEPDSDFRSSITLIDCPSNRFCFNDGYHTAHHLNPRRHWRDQPVHFLQSKEAYRDGRALVFHKIDYLMMTVTLLRKDYMHLASCLIPIGDQVGMSQVEIAAMLQSKTRRFTEEDIKKKFK